MHQKWETTEECLLLDAPNNIMGRDPLWLNDLQLIKEANHLKQYTQPKGHVQNTLTISFELAMWPTRGNSIEDNSRPHLDGRI